MTAEAEPSLPRFQQGARPQRLLTTLLGDYWFARREHIPSAALVQLMSEFGITAAGARAAIQRLAQRGFLVSAKNGRETAYAVTPRSREALDRHVQYIFAPPATDSWDGTWTIVAYSVPEEEKAARRTFREGLRAAHFGNLYDALWIRPGHHVETAQQLGEATGITQLTVFSAAEVPGAAEEGMVETAFELGPVRDAYTAFIQRWEPGGEALAGDGASAHDALLVRTRLMSEWRALVGVDPQLPRQLLGADWPGTRAYECCAALYDSLGPEAEARFRRIIAANDPSLADLVNHHTFANWASLVTTN